MKPTKEKSEEQANILKSIQTLILILDVDYLREALKEMKDQTSFRESALILSPQPMRTMRDNDLRRLKDRQLELYIQLADNLKAIITEQGKIVTDPNIEQLNKLFGL